MNRTCRQTGEPFEVTDADLAFYDKVSPNFENRKYPIPPPTLCPQMRLRRRLTFANQIHVYSRPSSMTGKHIFSMFPEDVPFPVYENEEWYGDSWDPLLYGRDPDFSRPFFEQYHNLAAVVPHFARFGVNLENSEYCNNVSEIKNCYFVFNTSGAEECFYCENAWDSTDCIDCTHTTNSELCCDCVMCTRCYNVQGSQDCEDCLDSMFLFNCRSCNHCFACVNLRHQEYCIFNQQHSRKEYERFITTLDLSSYLTRRQWEEKAFSFWAKHPRPHAVTRMVENVSGNYIFESRKVLDSFLVRSGENCRFCFNLNEYVKDCYDYLSFGRNAQLVYETARSGMNPFNIRFCCYCIDGCTELLYCTFCAGCEQCFGCVGLHKKRFCVFNKQYTREEYNRLVPQMIEHMQQTKEWGEFFPSSYSPFPYNHSHAQRYFPLSKDEAEAQGNHWYYRPLIADNMLDADKLPDHLPAGDDPLVVKSANSERAFRITSEDIRRLRKLSVPLPRTTYDERMNARAMKMGGVRLFQRNCAKTGRPLQTTIPPDSPWIVWDRKVYEEEFSS